MMTEAEKKLFAELTAKAQEENRLKVQAYENTGDDLVEAFIKKRKILQGELRNQKNYESGEVQSFIELALETANMKAEQTNFVIIHSKGLGKIEFSTAELGRYDSRADLASQKIKDFLSRIFLKESSSENEKSAYKMILSLLGKDRHGNFRPVQISQLIKMEKEFQDEEWTAGIELFKSSFQTTEAKSYVRVYEKGENGGFEYIPLDVNKI